MTRFLAAAVLVLVVAGLLVPASGSGATPMPAEPGKDGGSSTKDELPPEWDGSVVPLEDPAALPVLEAWKKVITSYRTAAFPQMERDLVALSEARLESGIPNVTVVSSALVFLARDLLARDPNATPEVISLVQTASSLSPDVPDFYFEYCRLLLDLDKTRVGEIFTAYVKGMEASATHLPSAHGAILGVVLVAWAVGLVLMVVFSLVFLFRYLPLFGHDICHVFPFRLAQWQSSLAALLLLLTPFLADLGLVPLFGLWWIALWAYGSRGERIVVVILALFVGAWPWADAATRASIRFPGSAQEKAYSCFYEECNRAVRATLEERLESGEAGEEALYVLAAARVRELGNGTVSPQKHRPWLLAMEAQTSGRMRAWFHVLLGNLEFADGVRVRKMSIQSGSAGMVSFLEARRHYEQALAMDVTNVPAAFNLSKLLLVLEEEQGSRDLLLEARERSPLRVSEQEGRSAMRDKLNLLQFNSNRELMLPSLPRRFRADWSVKGGTGELFLLQPLLLGPLSPAWLPFGMGILLLLGIGLSAVGRFFKLSRRCSKCDQIRCVRCWPEFSGTGLCHECVYYKLRGSYMDPKESWRREKKIEGRRQQIETTAIVLTFLLPGAGHFVKGRALRGLMFMAGVAFTLAVIFLLPFVAGLVSVGAVAAQPGTVIDLFLWGAVGLVFYVVSIIDIFSWR